MVLPTYSIIFAVAYICVMISYFFSETSGNFKRRVINKITLASMFWFYALIEMIRLGGFSTLYFMLFIGITFSYWGDIWLLWDFTKGGIVFAVGNVIIAGFIVAYMTQLGVPFLSYWWALILIGLFVGLFIILYKKGFYKYLKPPFVYAFVPYILSVSAHGCLSLVLIFVTSSLVKGNPQFATQLAFLFFGSMLFMISDYFIAWHNFRDKYNKAILRLNSGTYFTGLLLIVLSFTLFLK